MNNINKNKKMGLMVLGILILIIVFYGGMSYGKSQVVSNRNRSGGAQGNFTGQNFNPAGAGGAGGFRGLRGMGGFTAGEILSRDDKSITLKLMDGGSKIIFLGSATTISKSVVGTVSDLSTGAMVSIGGAANADGSINAQSIQIRPSPTAN